MQRLDINNRYSQELIFRGLLMIFTFNFHNQLRQILEGRIG